MCVNGCVQHVAISVQIETKVRSDVKQISGKESILLHHLMTDRLHYMHYEIACDIFRINEFIQICR